MCVCVCVCVCLPREWLIFGTLQTPTRARARGPSFCAFMLSTMLCLFASAVPHRAEPQAPTFVCVCVCVCCMPREPQGRTKPHDYIRENVHTASVVVASGNLLVLNTTFRRSHVCRAMFTSSNLKYAGYADFAFRDKYTTFKLLIQEFPKKFANIYYHSNIKGRMNSLDKITLMIWFLLINEYWFFLLIK